MITSLVATVLLFNYSSALLSNILVNITVSNRAMCGFVHRERTKLVYSMYSRMSGETVKMNLLKLGVDYFILEDSWCTRRTR